MQARDARLHHRALTGLPQRLLDFLLRFCDRLLDASRMDTAIHDEGGQGQSRHLAPDRIERREDDGFRRVINDDVHAGQGFERADVPSFTADDAAFDIIGGQRDDGHGRL